MRPPPSRLPTRHISSLHHHASPSSERLATGLTATRQRRLRPTAHQPALPSRRQEDSNLPKSPHLPHPHHLTLAAACASNNPGA